MSPLSIVSWNIDGLPSKFAEPGFLDYVTSFDVCCLLETFTSEEFDFSVHFSDYHVFHSPALKLSLRGRRSGGILVLVKKTVTCQVSQINCDKDNMIILRFKLCHLPIDLIVLCAYIPPADSPYYKHRNVKCNITLLEDEIFRLQTMYPSASLLICGDLNARTGNWNLHLDPEDEEDDSFVLPSTCLCYDVVEPRRSQDLCKNQFGEILIQLCKVFHLCILNGSVENDRMGRFTYLSHQGSSVIDYCLLGMNDFNVPIYLRVGDRIHSCHMPLEVSIGEGTQHKTKPPSRKETVHKFIWNPDKLQDVRDCIASPDFTAGVHNAELMLNSDNDLALNIFLNILLSNASCTYQTVSRPALMRRGQSMWFDVECHLSKRKVKEAL